MASQPDQAAADGGQPGDGLAAVPSRLRQRPGDQQLPVPNGRPSSHDLVIADIALCAAPQGQKTAAAELIAARRLLGLERYGSLLQAGNGRDCRRDLTEEIADACAYAKTWLEETGAPLGSDLERVYRQLLHLLCLIAGGLPFPAHAAVSQRTPDGAE